jgi:hypothetical protein
MGMKLGDCTAQGKISTVRRFVGGRSIVHHVPKRSARYTIGEVVQIMDLYGLGKIGAKPGGIIRPWAMACRIAYFKGNIEAALQTLPNDAREFYKEKLNKVSVSVSSLPGTPKNSH